MGLNPGRETPLYLSMNRGRVVLSPYGAPAHSETAEHYTGALLQCGADLARVFDDPRGSLGAYAQHISSARALSARDLSVLVVLTRCVPVLDTVVAARCALEARLPALENAAWLIYTDPLREPSTFTALSQGGTLLGDLESAPIWKGPDGLRYLVLSPLIAPHVEQHLVQRVRLVEYGAVGESGPVPVDAKADQTPRAHPSERPTVPVPAFTEQHPTLRVGGSRQKAG